MKRGLDSAGTLPPFTLSVVQRCVCFQKCDQTFVIITGHFHPRALKGPLKGGHAAARALSVLDPKELKNKQKLAEIQERAIKAGFIIFMSVSGKKETGTKALSLSLRSRSTKHSKHLQSAPDLE